MPQFSLYDFEEQLQQIQLVSALVLEPTTEETQLVIENTPPAVLQAAWRERDWLLEQAKDKPGSIALVRINRKRIATVPLDLDAALMLHNYRMSEAEMVTEQRRTKGGNWRVIVIKDGSSSDYTWAHGTQPGVIRACIPTDSRKEFDNRVYFPFRNLYATNPSNTFLVEHLTNAGFNVIIPRSLRKWIAREYNREEREVVPYSLPEIKDRRPLFDQAEEGMLLICNRAIGDFKAASKYVVVSLKDGNGSENGITLQEMAGEGETARLVDGELVWNNTTPMENYFAMEAGAETVYDPDKCLVALYPQQHERNVKRLEAMGLDLYRHTIYDAAQAALKRDVMNCKPQRMGKTSEAIATALLWGSKRIGIVSPSRDTRMEVKKELERLGISDFILVNKFSDLEEGKRQGVRFYLLDYFFVKGMLKDPAPRGNDKFHEDDLIARCPYCNEVLQRWEYEPINSDFGRWRREVKFGFACFNEACSFQWEAPKVSRVSAGRRRGTKEGAAWWDPEQKTRFIGGSAQRHRMEHGELVPDGENRRTGSGYVNLERAQLAKLYLDIQNRSRSGEVKDDHPRLQFKGRMHTGTITVGNGGRFKQRTEFVKSAWSPSRYKRFRKFFTCLIVDEIHMLASGYKTDQGNAVLGMQAKHHIGLTGTPMPNGPADPYWQCHWVFGGGTPLFPYFRNGEKGYTKYWKSFCKMAEIVNSEGKIRKKRLPIATAPLKQRKLHAPLIIRRTFADPLVQQSLQEKGFHYPTIRYHTLHCEPDHYQADLIVHAMDRFQEAYTEHTALMAAENHEINTAYVLSSMSLMKVAATCPDFLNLKLQREAETDQKIYLGVPGGGKTQEIRRIVHAKLNRGEKVLVVSFYKHELSILMDVLADYQPVLYDIDNWDETERFECRQRFLNDPDCKLLLGSIQALQVGVDMSSADNVICADLLWSPGKQDQAVARILKPTKHERVCDIYYTILNHSLDENIYSVFYSKRVASEQVMDGVITTPRPTDFNIRAFVDQVLAERSSMAKYALNVQAESTNYIPLLNTLATLRDRE